MTEAQGEVGPFLRALEADPGLHRAVYRLAVGCGLHELGYGMDGIAAAVGVSARQARQLIGRTHIARRPGWPLGGGCERHGD